MNIKYEWCPLIGWNRHYLMFSTFHMPSFSMLEPCSVLIHLFVLFANLTRWQCVLLDLLTLVGVVSPPTSVDVNFFYSHVISGGSFQTETSLVQFCETWAVSVVQIWCSMSQSCLIIRFSFNLHYFPYISLPHMLWTQVHVHLKLFGFLYWLVMVFIS